MIIIFLLILGVLIRNNLKKICANDLRFATRKKQQIQGKAILKKLEKSKGFREKTIVHLELEGIGKTPDFKLINSNFQDEHFYDLIEIYSILEHLEINSEITVKWVKQYRFSKKHAFISLDGVSLIGKKTNRFHFFKFGIFLFVFISIVLVLLLLYYIDNFMY